tara:strand:+ start:284 stop:1153 length:870 start_codon:yes stop_codon:yes gene_type:complete
MSTITVHDVQGFSTYNNTVRIPNGHKLDIAGDLKVPSHTTSGRPTAEVGAIGFNTTLQVLEVYVSVNGVNQWYALSKAAPDGETADSAAESGYQLAQDYPGKSSGYYWIKSSNMPSALQMWVDMVEEGGGYDMYAITGGTSVDDARNGHSGTSLGLDLIYPRSKEHWRAQVSFVQNQLGQTGGNLRSYFRCPGKVWNTSAGNYTGYVMRNAQYYGNGVPANTWRTGDGGRWWLRNNTYSEPNGNYTPYSFLYFWGNHPPDNYNGQDLLFDDAGRRSTGSNYLVSTNAKP